MIGAAVFACVGQLLWKLSVDHGIIFMLGGFALYGLGALLMLIAYRFGSVSALQPVLSLNYALSIALGAIILDEKIAVINIVGIVVITSGVLCIAGGDD